jgi:ABC transporter DrrB family efflux protein
MTTLDVTTLQRGLDTTRPRRASFVPSTLAVARRTLLKFARTPQLIVVGSIQGALFLLIFRYVFGGAISTSGISYVDFLVPGFITTGVLFSGGGAAAGVAEDIDGGVFDRLRSLPIPRSSAPAGRALADTALVVWGLVITASIGFAVGFRLHTDVAPALAAFALCVVFGFAFEWMFMCIGLFSGNAQAAQGMSMIVFPLSFVSSAYVPVSSMPGWMRAFAQNQPLTVMVNAVRALTEGHAVTATLGHTTGYYVGVSLLWALAITVVFAPIAIARYRRG